MAPLEVLPEYVVIFACEIATLGGRPYNTPVLAMSIRPTPPSMAANPVVVIPVPLKGPSNVTTGGATYLLPLVFTVTEDTKLRYLRTQVEPSVLANISALAPTATN